MHHILGYSSLGKENIGKANPEKLLMYFSEIKTSGDRLMLLLNDLLDLSKLESGQTKYAIKKADLSLTIEHLISEFSNDVTTKSILLEMRKPEFSTVISYDELRIGQVIRNLLSNAVKFTPVGKSILVSLENEGQLDGKRHTDKNTIPALTVCVKDEGIGIPDHELESIFDKFIQSSRTQTNAGGTGLGLSICHEIIRAHHGKIWAENNSEGGATFCFMLPYEQGPFR